VTLYVIRVIPATSATDRLYGIRRRTVREILETNEMLFHCATEYRHCLHDIYPNTVALQAVNGARSVTLLSISIHIFV